MKGDERGRGVARGSSAQFSGRSCARGAAERECPHAGSEQNQASASVTLRFLQDRGPGIDLPSPLLPTLPRTSSSSPSLASAQEKGQVQLLLHV